MQILSKNVFIISMAALFSCSNEELATAQVDKISKAKPVYNQAYQENFEADQIEDIVKSAKNAYVLIDPFQDRIPDKIDQIKANGNEVGGYISIGTGENWRSDFDQLEPYLVETPWGQWPGEYFVNETATGILSIMKARIDKMANWGCDWVEFDNMDWFYYNGSRSEYGFQVNEAEGIAFYQELCEYVHQRGMKCMAKNTVHEAPNFDGVLYESYADEKNWWDTDGTRRFLASNKLVIINHYNETSCDQIYEEYMKTYGIDISFICEDAQLKKYVHYNE